MRAECDIDFKDFVRRARLDTAAIAANSRACIEQELGKNTAELLSACHAVTTDVSAAMPDRALSHIDQLLSELLSAGTVRSGGALVARTPAEIVAALAEKLCEEVRVWIARLIDDPSQRLGGARRGLSCLDDLSTRVRGELQRIHTAISDRLAQICASSVSGGTKSAQVEEYFHLKLDDVTIRAAIFAVELVQAELKQLADMLTSFGREIEQISTAIARAANPAASKSNDISSNGSGLDDGTNGFETRIDEFAAAVDAKLQAEYIGGNGGLLNIVMKGGRPRAQLSAKLHELSREVVRQTLRSAQTGQQTLSGSMRSAVAIATPSFLEFGGERRILTLTPESSGSGEVVGTVQCTAMEYEEGSTTVCVEAANLSLEHIALEIVERRRDRVEFAERVHCRTDIDWTPLIAVDANECGSSWDTSRAQPAVAQEAMGKTLVL
jgi:hypothetical protein